MRLRNDMKAHANNITVIGLGLIGGSLCRAIRRFIPEKRLRGVDFQPVLDKALASNLVDEIFLTEQLALACSNAEMILIATPISKALSIMPVIAEAIDKETIVSDVCSIKVPLMEKAQQVFHPQRGIFIGGHPMAGSEKQGLEHADQFLFQNALYVLTPLADTPECAVSTVASTVQQLGAHVVLLDEETHDQIAAAVSHLPQILAVALMQYVAQKNSENPLYLRMAAGGFRDMTRIASGRFGVWEDICEGNSRKIIEEMDAFGVVLRKLRGAVASGGLQGPFEHAARTRLAIPADSKGFLTPHFDLSVEVEDKPGVIAAISSSLADAVINIKDIEVLKVRENEGGTLRLSFSSETDRQRSYHLLREKGFKCDLR